MALRSTVFFDCFYQKFVPKKLINLGFFIKSCNMVKKVNWIFGHYFFEIIINNCLSILKKKWWDVMVKLKKITSLGTNLLHKN